MAKKVQKKVEVNSEIAKRFEPDLSDYPIRSVRVYQAVTFAKSNETTFITYKNKGKLNPVNIKINSEFNGVEIWNEEHRIFVPMTNVSCITFDSEAYKKADEEMKEEQQRLVEQSAKLTDQSKRPL
jgi:uncharacterized protein YuzE